MTLAKWPKNYVLVRNFAWSIFIMEEILADVYFSATYVVVSYIFPVVGLKLENWMAYIKFLAPAPDKQVPIAGVLFINWHPEISTLI